MKVHVIVTIRQYQDQVLIALSRFKSSNKNPALNYIMFIYLIQLCYLL